MAACAARRLPLSGGGGRVLIAAIMKTRRPWVRLAILLPTLLLLAGCFETTQEFTLNPDGSGKVVHESRFQLVDFSGGKGNPDAEARKAAAEVIAKAKGVTAWRDVSFRRLDDGRVYFKGTAYFKNLSTLEFPNQTMLDFTWTPGADGTGVLALRPKQDTDQAAAGANPPVDWSKLSPAERTAKMAEARAKFQQMKPMMAGILGTMKHTVVFHLPGHPGGSALFATDATGALRLQFDGAKMLAALETLLNDDAWMEKNSGTLGGQGMPEMDEHVSELVFGGKGPARAAVTGLGGAAFDFAAEVAAAQAEFPAVQQQLSLPPPAVAAPASAGPIPGARIVGVRLARDLDEQLDLRPFGAGAGYTLAVLVGLPRGALAMTEECGLDVALADDGTDLLPESEFNRRISFPKLSADKSAVLIEAELKAPGPAVRGLKELSGHLQYSAASGTKTVDLGFAKLAPGAKGKELEAQVDSLQAGDGHDNPGVISLTLKLTPDSLKALRLATADQQAELKQTGYSGGGDSFTFTFESANGFPPKCRLVAEVYDQLQTYNVPFKLENVSLLGEPANAK